jgi:hypothetical protein
MRFESDEAVEQGLDHVGPLVLMAGRADADVVKGESIGGSFLDLMLEQESTRGRRCMSPSASEQSTTLMRPWQTVPLKVASTASLTLI